LFHFLERPLLFRPTRAEESWQNAPPYLRAEDVFLTLADRTQVHGWWCPTENWTPASGAVLYCHGNASNLSHRSESVRRWQERIKMGILIFDYPGYGKSSGKPTEANCYASAEAFRSWLLRERGVAPEDLLLFGGSLGGAVAIEVATRHPYRALVLVSAFTSVPDMAAMQFRWLPVRRFIRNRFENLAKIGKLGRVFIAHGTGDRTIPFEMGERLYSAARDPKRFFRMEGYDHNHSPGPEFYTSLEHFLWQIASSVV